MQATEREELRRTLIGIRRLYANGDAARELVESLANTTDALLADQDASEEREAVVEKALALIISVLQGKSEHNNLAYAEKTGIEALAAAKAAPHALRDSLREATEFIEGIKEMCTKDDLDPYDDGPTFDGQSVAMLRDEATAWLAKYTTK